MLQLASGVRIDGDQEVVYSAVADEQASGDGLYASDIAATTGLSEDRVHRAVRELVETEVLTANTKDPDLGPRYVVARAV